MTLMLSRRGARGALVACGALAVLLTAMSFAWPAAVPSASGKPDTDPLLLLPQSTIGFLSFDGGPCTANAKSLALADLWNEPEVQAFLKPVIGLTEGLAQVGEFLPGLESGDLIGLLRGRVIIALTGLAMPDDEHADPRPQLMAAIRFGGPPERIGKLVTALERKVLAQMRGAKPKPVTVGGEPAKRMEVGDGVAVIWLVHEGWLLVGTSEEQLGAGLTRLKSGEAAGSIMADDLWKAAAPDLVRPQTVMSFWVGIAKLMPMFQAQMPKPVLDQLKMYKSVGWAMDLDGKVIHDRIVMDGVKGHPMYASLMNTKADVPHVLSIMPKSTMVAGAGALDIVATYDYLVSTLASAGAGAPDFGAQFAKETGVKLKEDLLANLGPEYGYYVAPTPHGLIPDFGIVMRTKDPVKMTATLKRIVASVSPSMLLDPVEYNGATIEVVDLLAVTDDHGGTNRQVFPRICWTFVGDYLVITPWPQAAKRVIDGVKRQDGGVLARPELASMLAAARQETATAGELALMYIDLPVMAAFALDTLAPAAQWAVPGSISQINIGALPTTEAITKHLSGMLMTSQWTASGLSTTTTSPAGMLPAMALLVGPAVAIGASTAHWRAEAELDRAARDAAMRAGAEPAEPAPASRPKPKKADDEDGDK